MSSNIVYLRDMLTDYGKIIQIQILFTSLGQPFSYLCTVGLLPLLTIANPTII